MKKEGDKHERRKDIKNISECVCLFVCERKKERKKRRKEERKSSVLNEMSYMSGRKTCYP